MAMDSKELKEHLAGLAVRYGVDQIILQPEATKVWEYDRHGKLVRAGTPAYKSRRKGKCLKCVRPSDSIEGIWTCGVDDKAGVEETSFTTQLPE